MTPTKETRTRQQDLLERILAMVESIDRNVEDILDELHDHLTDLRYTGWPDEPSAEQDAFD